MFAVPARAADILFPTPLHLTRQIRESIGNKDAVVEQYCYGNRVVSVSGSITTIADYEREELTEIDRQAGTYSITRFEQVAKALRATGVAAIDTSTAKWTVRPTGTQQMRANRISEAFEGTLEEDAVKRHVRVGVDRNVALSKDALDVLIGAAYPNDRKPEDHVVVEAARSRAPATQSTGSSGPARTYALPVEQHFELVIEDDRAEIHELVTRVGDELAPADVLAIPPGAKLVESRLLTRARMIEALAGQNVEQLRRPLQ
jgi:hypothetical protein